jgi:hypothetical protein
VEITARHICRKLLRAPVDTSDANDADVDSAALPPSGSAIALSEFFKSELLEGTALPPLLLALAVATAAAAVLRSTVDPAVDALAAAAEDGDVWGALAALLAHEGLEGVAERGVIGTVVFEVVSAVSMAFSLDISALPRAHVDSLLKLLNDVLRSDKLLAWCA